MLHDNTKSVKCEEVVLYSSYLGLDEDSQYIRFLIDYLTDLFLKKANKINNLTDLENNLNNLRYSKEEIKALGPFGEECLDFKNSLIINIQDQTFYLDKYGVIVGDNNNYLGKNMLEVPELRDYTLFLRKQIFVSKIYQAVKSNIKVKKGKKYAKIFEYVNNEYLNYENSFKLLTKDLTFPKEKIRKRSLR